MLLADVHGQCSVCLTLPSSLHPSLGPLFSCSELATLKFWYRNDRDYCNYQFSPYSPFAVSHGGTVYPTAAHLFWTYAFEDFSEVRSAIRWTGQRGGQSSIFTLLSLVAANKDLMARNPTFHERRLGGQTLLHRTSSP